MSLKVLPTCSGTEEAFQMITNQTTKTSGYQNVLLPIGKNMEMHPFLMKKKSISRAGSSREELTVSENNIKLRNTPRRKMALMEGHSW